MRLSQCQGLRFTATKSCTDSRRGGRPDQAGSLQNAKELGIPVAPPRISHIYCQDLTPDRRRDMDLEILEQILQDIRPMTRGPERGVERRRSRTCHASIVIIVDRDSSGHTRMPRAFGPTRVASTSYACST